jgi:hypothetical protein
LLAEQLENRLWLPHEVRGIERRRRREMERAQTDSMTRTLVIKITMLLLSSSLAISFMVSPHHMTKEFLDRWELWKRLMMICGCSALIAVVIRLVVPNAHKRTEARNHINLLGVLEVVATDLLVSSSELMEVHVSMTPNRNNLGRLSGLTSQFGFMCPAYVPACRTM